MHARSKDDTPKSDTSRSGARAAARQPPAYGVALIDELAATPMPALEHEARGLAERGSATPRAVVVGKRPIQGLLGSGEPLPGRERARHEAWLGASLDAVRLHRGVAADALARSRRTPAFACGPDIVLGASWSPGSKQGGRVLAHELAHTTQRATSRGGQPAVLGFEGPEHRRIGDEYLDDLRRDLDTPQGRAWAEKYRIDAGGLAKRIDADPFSKGKRKIAIPRGGESKPLELSPGEVIALAGDHYEGASTIASADRTRLANTLGIMQDQQHHRIDNEEASKRFERNSVGKYTELAKGNVTHFAVLNRRMWEDAHRKAIALARRGELQLAYLHDAAGSHYLSDAYSAGHVFDGMQIEARIALHYARNPPRAKNRSGQALLGALSLTGDSLLVKLAVKNVHDRLARGFEVRNAVGMRWTLPGDDKLETSPETQRIAALAVFLSRDQITRASRGEAVDFSEVTNLLPDADTTARATAFAESVIPECAHADALLELAQSNLGMLPTAADVALRNVPLLNFLHRPIAAWATTDILGAMSLPPPRPGSDLTGPLPGISRLPGLRGGGPPMPGGWSFNATLFQFDANFGKWTSPYSNVFAPIAR